MWTIESRVDFMKGPSLRGNSNKKEPNVMCPLGSL